jgi:hypothetical protein
VSLRFFIATIIIPCRSRATGHIGEGTPRSQFRIIIFYGLHIGVRSLMETGSCAYFHFTLDHDHWDRDDGRDQEGSDVSCTFLPGLAVLLIHGAADLSNTSLTARLLLKKSSQPYAQLRHLVLRVP